MFNSIISKELQWNFEDFLIFREILAIISCKGWGRTPKFRFKMAKSDLGIKQFQTPWIVPWISLG